MLNLFRLIFCCCVLVFSTMTTSYAKTTTMFNCELQGKTLSSGSIDEYVEIIIPKNSVGYLTSGQPFFYPKDSTVSIKAKVSGIIEGGNCTSADIDMSDGKTHDLMLANVTVSNVTLTDVYVENADYYSKVTTNNIKFSTINGANIENFSIIDEPKQNPFAVSREDKNIPYVGDTLQFNVKVPGFTLFDDSTNKTKYEASAESCFKVVHEFAPNEYKKNSENLLLGYFFVSGWGCTAPKGKNNPVSINTEYVISKSKVTTYYSRIRKGAVYGILVTPFKFYFTNRRTSNGSSIGPYFGMRIYDQQGTSTSLVGTIGVTSEKSSDGVNHSGVSLAIAYLINVKNVFNFGFLVGTDIYQKGPNRPTNSEKPWVGVNIGFNME